MTNDENDKKISKILFIFFILIIILSSINTYYIFTSNDISYFIITYFINIFLIIIIFMRYSNNKYCMITPIILIPICSIIVIGSIGYGIQEGIKISDTFLILSYVNFIFHAIVLFLYIIFIFYKIDECICTPVIVRRSFDILFRLTR